VTRAVTSRLAAYAGLAAVGLLGALVAGRPELVVVALPFAILPAVALATARDPRLRVETRVDRGRVLQGEEVEVRLAVEGDAPVERLDLLLVIPPGLEVVRGGNPVTLHLPAGRREELSLRVRAARWGAYRLGETVVRARDPLGHVVHEGRGGRASELRAYPRPERLLELVSPLETQVFTGNRVAREKGEGIEFADLRPFVPGDRIRRVNWRASARRQELWVNELHAERNADVVIVLDSFAEAGPPGAGTLDLAVRAAAGLAAHYLDHKDRVGLVAFGGVLNWLLPGSGLVQRYKIADAVLDTRSVLSYAWKDFDVLPRRTLPPKALVVALTPLLDERAARALLDLRARGFDLAVVEVTPEPYVEPGAGAERRLAYRLWRLKRDAVRGAFRRVGVPVATWDGRSAPLAGALGEVTASRRFARRVSA
jgi:uncharacterized protein (DUF58 family)